MASRAPSATPELLILTPFHCLSLVFVSFRSCSLFSSWHASTYRPLSHATKQDNGEHRISPRWCPWRVSLSMRHIRVAFAWPTTVKDAVIHKPEVYRTYRKVARGGSSSWKMYEARRGSEKKNPSPLISAVLYNSRGYRQSRTLSHGCRERFLRIARYKYWMKARLRVLRTQKCDLVSRKELCFRISSCVWITTSASQPAVSQGSK